MNEIVKITQHKGIYHALAAAQAQMGKAIPTVARDALGWLETHLELSMKSHPMWAPLSLQAGTGTGRILTWRDDVGGFVPLLPSGALRLAPPS